MCLRDVLIVCLSPDASNLACYSSSVITLTTFFYNKLFLSICLSYQTMSSDFKVCKDMLLLLLSHFSPVRLCVTPQMAAHQAPPSLGFSRQEHQIYLLTKNLQCDNVRCWASGIESACQCRRHRLIPGQGRSPGVGNGNPLQYSCLENSMDRGAWRATVHGVAKNRT